MIDLFHSMFLVTITLDESQFVTVVSRSNVVVFIDWFVAAADQIKFFSVDFDH